MSRGRAWSIAAAGGLVVLALIGSLANTAVADPIPDPPGPNAFGEQLLFILASPRWHISTPNAAERATLPPIKSTTDFLVGEWITVAVVILLTVLILRAMAHSLDFKRGGFGAFIGAWGATAAASTIGFVCGGLMLWISINSSLSAGGLANYLVFTEARSGALYGVLIGWVVGIVALVITKVAPDVTEGAVSEGTIPPPGPLRVSPLPPSGGRPNPMPGFPSPPGLIGEPGEVSEGPEQPRPYGQPSSPPPPPFRSPPPPPPPPPPVRPGSSGDGPRPFTPPPPPPAQDRSPFDRPFGNGF